MKRAVYVLLILVFVFSLNVFPQEQSAEDQEMMKKWMEYATPGKYHKGLEYFTGKWEAVSRAWMKPGDEPVESKGKMAAKMILGGRYLESASLGEMMPGMEFSGLSILGYDNLHKKFVGIWIDSAGTGIFPYEGTLDETGKIRTDTAVWDDFMSGGKYNVRMVTTIIDDNSYRFEMFMKYPESPEFRSMEMTYTRVKCDEMKKCCGKKDRDGGRKCLKMKDIKK